MPGTKRSDKPDERFIIFNLKLAPHSFAADVWLKTLGINAVRIDHNLLVFDSDAQKIAPLDFGDDEDARGGFQIESLVAFQQSEPADAIPVTPDPNFRAVVFEKERPCGLQTRLDTGPAETAVALIDEIRLPLSDLFDGVVRKQHVVV